MKKFTVFLFFAALAALYAGNASAQTAVEIPSHPLDGYTPEQIFTSGDTFTRTLNFDNSTVEYQGKGFFYSFTLAEPAVITYSSTPHIVSELSYIYPRATLLTNLTGYGYNEHGEIQLYDNPETTVLGTGTHYMVVFVDDYQPGTTLTVSFGKAVLPVTPLALPCDTTLTMAQGEEKYYSFTLTEPATPEVTFPDFTTSPEYGESLAWNIRNESLLREFAYGYCSADGTKQQDTRLLPAGKYYFILNANVNNPFRLKITPQIPAAITLPYDQNITMQPNENKVMQFTLAEESIVVLSEVTTEGSGGIDLIDSNNYFIDFLFPNKGYSNVVWELLPAGTYYVSMETYDDSLAVNLSIKTMNPSAVSSYTAADYSAVLPKGMLVSGTLDGDNMSYYDIGEGADRERYYSLVKGFNLAVEKGNEYTFSNVLEATGLVVLRTGNLTGNLYTDMLAINEVFGEGTGSFTFTAVETGNVRILVTPYNELESGAYTFKVTEKANAAPIISIAELCAQAAELAYSTNLSQTLQIDLSAASPRIQAEYTAPEDADEDEISHLEWIGHAKAYKINIPENNSGISIDAGYNPVLIYRKTGNEYKQLLLIDESDDVEGKIPAEYTGEWYMVCMNIPFAPVSAYTLNIWVTDKPLGSGIPLKTLLDSAAAVTLPYSKTGNMAADGTAVSDLDKYISPRFDYRPKVTVRKITVTEDNQTLYVRSNFNYTALLEIDDNEPESQNPGIFRRLRAVKAAGDDYRTLYSTWGGNMEYSVSKGDYWVIGIGEEGLDFRLQISISQPEVLTFTAVAANAQSIGVNKNASEVEIKAVLSLLKLTATMPDGSTMAVENHPLYWTVAAGEQQAMLNGVSLLIRNFNHLSTDDATALAADIAPLAIQIKYTGNDVPDGIAGTESAKLTVYTAGSRITVNGMEAGTLWQLFDISGKPAAQGKASGSTLEIDAPQRGIYIFRAGAKALKTVVK